MWCVRVIPAWDEQDAHLSLSTVALLSVLHKAVAALLAPHQVLHVGHVEETHAPPLLEVAVQVPLAAATEDTWERMAARGQDIWLLSSTALLRENTSMFLVSALKCCGTSYQGFQCSFILCFFYIYKLKRLHRKWKIRTSDYKSMIVIK